MLQVTVPDVHPAALVQKPGLLSMCAGDFVEVYSAPDQAASFDCVATCFFLDTAHNILQYMQIIRHILKVRSQFASGANLSQLLNMLGSVYLVFLGSVHLVLLERQPMTSAVYVDHAPHCESPCNMKLHAVELYWNKGKQVGVFTQ